MKCALEACVKAHVFPQKDPFEAMKPDVVSKKIPFPGSSDLKGQRSRVFAIEAMVFGQQKLTRSRTLMQKVKL